MEMVERIIAQWAKRNLSMSGKLCIIKTFMISQFVYPMQALIMPQHIITKLNTILFRFLWKRKYSNKKAFEKVKRIVICNSREEGGIQMINMEDMQTSFLLAWIANLNESGSEKWRILPIWTMNSLGYKLACLHASVTSKRFIGLDKIKLCFWKQALCKWLDNKNLWLNSKSNFLNQCLWNNCLVQYKNKPLCFEKWARGDIIYVKDIWKDDDIVPMDQICARLGNSPTRMFEFCALRTALMSLRLKHDNVNNQNTCDIFENRNPCTITPRSFRLLITKGKAVEPCAQKFWLNKYNVNFKKFNWTVAYSSTKEERLRLLHWKILHNIYPTNILLHKMGLRDNNRCSYCLNTDYIEHFFYQCGQIKRFWTHCISYIYKRTNQQILLTETEVLFGYRTDQTKLLFVRFVNHVILIAKMVISKFRYWHYIEICTLFDFEIEARKKYLNV